MNLIFVNRFFHPDHSATSQLVSDLAFALVKQGQAVSVITSRQRYDAPTENLPAKGIVDAVRVNRVWTTRFGRANLLGRAMDYATFYVSAAWCLWRLARAGDVVIAKTDPPMVSVVAGPVCWVRSARLVNWLQDIFPEVAEELGFRSGVSQAAFGVLRWLRNRSLSHAAINVVVGERMAARLAALGLEKERIRIIANWADGDSIEPVAPVANALRKSWGLQRRFVVGYSGNLGRAHETDTLLQSITELQRINAPIAWLFIGGGVLYQQLQQEIERRGVKSVQFRPYQPRERLAESLSVADVHLVSLRPELEGLVVPSKFYGIAAAGRPTIFIGDPDGEIARLISRHGCGRAIAMGDGAGLTRAILDLAGDPDSCGRMGERARKAFEAEFSRVIAVAKWKALLDSLRPTTSAATYAERAIAEDPTASAKNAQ